MGIGSTMDEIRQKASEHQWDGEPVTISGLGETPTCSRCGIDASDVGLSCRPKQDIPFVAIQ
jgi:hypothetical protein